MSGVTMNSPFAKMRVFGGALPSAPGVVINSVHCFDRPKDAGLLERSYMPLPEAALTLGIDEADLEYYVRTRRVRFLPGRKRDYFFMDHLREDLASLTVPTAHSAGGNSVGRQHRRLSDRKAAEHAGQIQASAGGGI